MLKLLHDVHLIGVEVPVVRQNVVIAEPVLLSAVTLDRIQDVFELTLLLLRAITMACRGHHDVVLENLALRHQLRTLQRRVKRPHLRTCDRMFWVLLATAWRRWRSALVLVQPETV